MRAAPSRAPRLCRCVMAAATGAHCLGAALWALGCAFGLCVLAACIAVATRFAAADGGLKLHAWCASLAPELFEAAREAQEDGRTFWSTVL
eukprot:15444613-Alexandrium_andersonii.AAC.1